MSSKLIVLENFEKFLDLEEIGLLKVRMKYWIKYKGILKFVYKIDYIVIFLYCS